MSKRYSDLRYLLLIISLGLALGFFNLAWAAPPEIDSITPDMGSSEAPTQVTIYGAGFQPTPKAPLYGGGPYITGSYDTLGSAWGVYVTGPYVYVADGSSGLQVIEKFTPLPDIQYVDSGTLIATVPWLYPRHWISTP